MKRSIDQNGYIRVGGKREHRLVWEAVHGPIPPGMEIHHIDKNKQNNAISNLMLVDPLTHKRLDSGCTLISGVWYKPCPKCNRTLPISHYYIRADGSVATSCKDCIRRQTRLNRLRRRLKR